MELERPYGTGMIPVMCQKEPFHGETQGHTGGLYMACRLVQDQTSRVCDRILRQSDDHQTNVYPWTKST